MEPVVETSMGAPGGRIALRWLVALGLVAAILLLLGSPVLAAGSATGHAQFHSILALAALVPAGFLVGRRGRASMASRAPAIGLWLLAGTQLIEGLGALGFGADGYSRVNDLVVLHDLGLTFAPIGFVGAAMALAVGVGSLVGRRSGRPRLAAGVTSVIGLVGLFGVAKLIGL